MAVGKNEKLESFKLKSLNLESCAEIGKNPAKLERSQQSWKLRAEVGKLGLKLVSMNEVGKCLMKLESLN